MSFFKSIGKTLKAVVKDAVPIAAGVMTGGASLAVLKPTHIMERVDKATGLPVSSIYNAVSGGGVAPAESQAVQTQQSVAPPMQPASNVSIYDQITPYLNSFMQANQKSVVDSASNANVLAASQPQPKSNMMLFVLGGLGLAVVSFLLLRRK